MTPTAVQDSQTPRCLSCDYPLMSLSEHRCPECGRAFDPADPRTVRTPRSPGKIARFLLRPPGWPTHVVAVFVLLMSFAAGTPPGGYFVALVISVFLWKIFLIAWAIRLAIWVWLRKRYKNDIPASRRKFWHWLSIPASAFTSFILLSTNVPFNVAFWLSRSSIDALANETISGTDLNPKSRWAGLYYADEIERIPGGMRFVIPYSGFIDRYGFAWSSTPLPQNGREEYSHLDGAWYTWKWDF
ncbi:MAG TPA: hypothetical protein VJZ71_02665 [Phycisphaerae bacterium]|nr:hypothetical protein [Phycisphaerae bacterium]